MGLNCLFWVGKVNKINNFDTDTAAAPARTKGAEQPFPTRQPATLRHSDTHSEQVKRLT